jgi:hypothetical protein
MVSFPREKELSHHFFLPIYAIFFWQLDLHRIITNAVKFSHTLIWKIDRTLLFSPDVVKNFPCNASWIFSAPQYKNCPWSSCETCQ